MTFDENINGGAQSTENSLELSSLHSVSQRLYRTAIDSLGAELDEGRWFFREIGLLHAEAYGPAGSLVLLVWPDHDESFADRLAQFRKSLDKKAGVIFVVFTGRPSAMAELQALGKGPTGLIIVNESGELSMKGQKNRALAKSLKALRPSHEPLEGWYERQRVVLRDTRKVRRDIDSFRAQLLARPVTATRSLLVVLGLAFIAQFLLGGASPPSLVRLGAGVLHDGPFEFHPGRLLGSMLLHGNLIHVAVNGLALHIAGGLVERLYGASRLLLVLALSGIAGAMASHFSGDAPFSVGFSGALFGLFGVLGGLVLKTEESELPRGVYRQFRRQVFATLLLNAGISFLPMIDAAAHFGGAAAGFLLVSTRTIQTVSLVGPAGHALRFMTAFMIAAMLGSYVEFLRGSKPNLLWKDPVVMVPVGESSLSIPLPASLHGQSHSLEQTPDGMALYRFGKMGDAYSIGAGRRALLDVEAGDFKLSNLLDEVSAALEKASARDDFVMKEKPRAVSAHGAEWVEVEFAAPSLSVVVNQYVGVRDGAVYHFRLERLDTVPAAVRLNPKQMWLAFFVDTSLLLE